MSRTSFTRRSNEPIQSVGNAPTTRGRAGVARCSRLDRTRKHSLAEQHRRISWCNPVRQTRTVKTKLVAGMPATAPSLARRARKCNLHYSPSSASAPATASSPRNTSLLLDQHEPPTILDKSDPALVVARCFVIRGYRAAAPGTDPCVGGPSIFPIYDSERDRNRQIVSSGLRGVFSSVVGVRKQRDARSRPLWSHLRWD